jgi:hypothetical protein
MSNINLCDCEEHWMEIKNKKSNLYLLSSKGRLYSYQSGKYIGHNNKRGYVSSSSFFFSDKIHRLVYRYFNQINIEDYDKNYNNIDHLDTIKNHNCICNLKLCSSSENNNNPITKKTHSKSMKGNLCGKGNKGIPKSEEHKQKISENRLNESKDFKCFFCDSKFMDISHYTRWHGNGKCLF